MEDNIKYSVIVKGYDWGPGISKIVIHLDFKVSSLEDNIFKVNASKEYFLYDSKNEIQKKEVGTKEIKVLDNYLSDKNGNKINGKSDKITLKLEVHPDNVFTHAYNLNYEEILYKEESIEYGIVQVHPLITDDGSIVKGMELTKENQLEVMKPEVEDFNKNIFEYSDSTYGEIKIPYAYYKPEKNKAERPLIILLHGAAEGGTNAELPLYGIKGAALASNQIQNYFKGSYVLLPQAKTMWMDDGTGNYTKDGNSMYTKSLLALIETFITNENIDSKKVYIGGVSNGGYMTIKMLLTKPELFTAGFPICQAYASEWISESELQVLNGIPLWFIHSKNDEVISFEQTSGRLINRLKIISEADIQLTTYEEVIDRTGLYKDVTGEPYLYSDHWSWIDFFNDEVYENGQSIFEWLNSKEKL